PDNRLPRDRAEQRDEHPFEVRPAAKGFGERRLGGRPLFLHAPKNRALLKLEADPERDAKENDRDEEGNAPPPVSEGFLAHEKARCDDDEQCGEQTKRCGGLDEAGEEALSITHKSNGWR